MRLRRKPWARPELEACPFYVQRPAERRGHWHEAFSVRQPLYLELGCGKGGFIAQTAPAHPACNFIAIDIKSEVLALAKRKLEQAYAAAGLAPDNIRILNFEISLISQLLSPDDTVDGIFINFPNPWPKSKHQKRRLTHPRQLEQYQAFLKPGGTLRVKTDDAALYGDSLDYLEHCGFNIARACCDLYADGVPDGAVLTEHEAMFISQGLPIHLIEAYLA